ncbi:MAG: hypothetical protein HRT38_19735 [Alteromonadaceae bacterium]|nr:hypothetical protein [Alteromonadaceae bacterium]
MIEVDSDKLWEKLTKLSLKTKCKKAAVAYVSDDVFISFDKGDVLVVDASEESISFGRTSAKILSDAFNKGAAIYSCDTLHGKTIVFDQHAYIGSANISTNSKENLNEVGIISDHPDVMSGAIKFIDGLKSQSLKVDRKYIEKILKIKVKKTIPSRKKKRKIEIGKSSTWLISVRNDAEYPGNKSAVDDDSRRIAAAENESAAWFWMKNSYKYSDKIKSGDSVVIIEREETKATSPEYAYRHFAIQEITDDTVSKTKAYHYASSNEHRIEWSKFTDLAEQTGISRLGSGLNTLRKLTKKQSSLLFELWSFEQKSKH